MFYKKLTYLLSTLFVLVSTINCSPRLAKDKAYTNFVEPFAGLDYSPLKDRIIVLDPGHGGSAPGAVGSGGLMEKDINLRVALKLQQYLEDADANVIMTRTTDTDLFIDEIDINRGNDLDYRVRLSNIEKADLFISLHHNSLLPMNRDYNATETYYKMEDSYSSFDAARSIHKHLAINLQTPVNIVRPGNYYVIRKNERTAILGEPSHLSNSRMEKLLQQSDKADFEAKSYFLGILDYFSNGVPTSELIYPQDGEEIALDQPVISIKITDDGFGGGIDPQNIYFSLNGTQEFVTLKDNELKFIPKQPLRNRSHRVEITAGNRKGNHSLFKLFEFSVNLPPDIIRTTITPNGRVDLQNIETEIIAAVFDKNLNPVKDGTIVKLVSDSTILHIEKETRNGRAYFYLPKGTDSKKFIATSGDISVPVTISDLGNSTNTIVFSTADKGTESILEGVRLEYDETSIKYTNGGGKAYFTQSKNSGTVKISAAKDGYFPVHLTHNLSDKSSSEKIEMNKVLNGILIGKRIAIDPEFGGFSTGAVGPTGLRAADENFQTAMYLNEFLRKAGAEVLMTREIGDDTTPHFRVRKANKEDSQLFLSLRHGGIQQENGSTGIIYAHPTSGNGKRLANEIKTSLANLSGVQTTAPVESAEFVLLQTACPAVIIDLGNITDADMETKLYGKIKNRSDAYGIFNAIITYFSGDQDFSHDFSGMVKDSEGIPMKHALVSLNDIFYLQTNTDGSFKFMNLENMPYTLKIEANGHKTKIVEISEIELSKTLKEFQLIK